ncbi:MAG TPA: methyltransferase domain-containing protein [Candidatus Didemnitutus sp.]|nr:methyltransferase domain-containing protein [Candidatus Didemnitutus sp.]
MKVPESGMPAEAYWESLFDVPLTLDRLAIRPPIADVIELGCGYGTFTIPVAQQIDGTIHTFDIERAMVDRTLVRATGAGVANINAIVRDVLSAGFGLADQTCGACLLFNILHCPNPEALLNEAARVVRTGGRVLVTHWRSDIVTPRGPPLSIRPRPEQVHAWATAAGLRPDAPVHLPPWHFGIVLRK